jgi:hypothetical protein
MHREKQPLELKLEIVRLPQIKGYLGLSESGKGSPAKNLKRKRFFASLTPETDFEPENHLWKSY